MNLVCCQFHHELAILSITKSIYITGYTHFKVRQLTLAMILLFLLLSMLLKL